MRKSEANELNIFTKRKTDAKPNKTNICRVEQRGKRYKVKEKQDCKA